MSESTMSPQHPALRWASIREAWNRFFFAPIGPESIALFRIAVGFLGFAWIFLLLPDYWTWFGSDSPWSWESAYRQGRGTLVYWWVFGKSDYAVLAVWLIMAASSLGVMLGFRTRTCAALAFVAMTSLAWRNVFIFNSGDTLLRLIMLFLVGSPAGHAYSIDERLRRRRGQSSEGQVYAPWAQRLVQLQLTWVYLVSFWAKFAGPDWLDGTAIYYVLRLEQFMRFPVPPFISDNLLMCRFLSWGTLAVELAMGTLVWFRALRPWVLLAAVGLHLSIEYSMNIPIFQWVMLGALTSFVEPATVRRAVAWASSKVRGSA